MGSSKLMASSSSSDLKRKLSSCASTEFLKFDSGDNFASDYLGRHQGHRPGLETESSSSTLLNSGITPLDASGDIAPISNGDFEPRRGVRGTVDGVWREIVAGKKSEKQQPKGEMMTLEDFLAKACAEEEEAEAEMATKGILEVKEELMSGSVYDEDGSKSEKAAHQRKKRMIKNRESAARSRERKQAYRVELESMAARLEEENERLFKETEDQKKKRLKQLMENVIPVVEKRRPPRLRRIRSMQW